jgi:parvulin-like peptidyl-prolyl isomerase
VRKAAALLCIAALALAACGKSGDSQAASVNNAVITDNNVINEVKAIAGNPQLSQQIEASGQVVSGPIKGSFDAGFAAQVLANQMNYELVRQEVARRNLVITSACLDKSRQDLFTNYGNGTASDGEALFNSFPKQYQDLALARNASVTALEADLAHQTCGAADAGQTYYTNHQSDFEESCLSGIAVDDQATADSLAARARAGEDFAALAQQYSTDAQTKAAGGDIGCHLLSEVPDDLRPLVAAANPGDVLDPIPNANGLVLYKLTDRKMAQFSDVQSQADELADQELVKGFNTWLQQAQAAAHIHVAPRWGTFDQASFTIQPPANQLGPTTTTTTTLPPDQTQLPTDTQPVPGDD